MGTIVAPKRISIFMALLLIAVGSAYYFSENSISGTENQQDPYIDSLSADNRPSITARRDTVPEPVGEDLAPGTALIRTTILSVAEEEGEVQEITVQVEEVLGYGSSTPPITTDTQFSFAVSHYLEKNSDLKDHITVDGQIEILVSHQEGIQTADSDKKQRWSFVELNPIKE